MFIITIVERLCLIEEYKSSDSAMPKSIQVEL